MNTKRKIVSSVLTMLSLIFIAVVAISLPISMQNAQMQASANYYSSYGVAATVSGNYYLGNTAYKMVSGENEEVVFASANEQLSPALDPAGNIELSSTNNFVVFEYKFINNSETVSFVAQFSNIIETENMNLTYGFSYSKLNSFESIDQISLDNIPLIYGQNNELYIYIKAKVDNLNKNSLLAGTFCFNLVAEEVYEIILENGTKISKTYATLGYVPRSVDVPTYPGLKFEGYFTEREGQGDMIFDQNGEATGVWAQTEGTTLYSYYTIAL